MYRLLRVWSTQKSAKDIAPVVESSCRYIARLEKECCKRQVVDREDDQKGIMGTKNESTQVPSRERLLGSVEVAISELFV